MNALSSPIPVIAELIAHRGAMLLLDYIVTVTESSMHASAQVNSSAWYSNEHGNMPAWIGLELMAQTIAAFVGWEARHQLAPVKKGVLLGSRNFQSNVSEFLASEPLEITATLVFRAENGLGTFNCEIKKDQTILATATLNVYEPANFEQFMQKQKVII